jgi:hypothetical protein
MGYFGFRVSLLRFLGLRVMVSSPEILRVKGFG